MLYYVDVTIFHFSSLYKESGVFDPNGVCTEWCIGGSKDALANFLSSNHYLGADGADQLLQKWGQHRRWANRILFRYPEATLFPPVELPRPLFGFIHLQYHVQRSFRRYIKAY
jgi:hypothetical protein